MGKSNHKGFTLIELIIIIVVIGILSTVGFEKYQRLDVEAQKSVCRTALGNLRSGISIYEAYGAVTIGIASWPELDTISTPGIVMMHDIPVNPFQSEANAPDSIVEGLTPGVIVGTRGGWAYKPSTGEIWPNTSTTIPGSGCQGPVDINENTW